MSAAVPASEVAPSSAKPKHPLRYVGWAVGSWVLVVFLMLLNYSSLRHIVGCATPANELSGSGGAVVPVERSRPGEPLRCIFDRRESDDVENEPASPALLGLWALTVLLHVVLCGRCIVKGDLANKLIGGVLFVLSPATCFGLLLYAVFWG